MHFNFGQYNAHLLGLLLSIFVFNNAVLYVLK